MGRLNSIGVKGPPMPPNVFLQEPHTLPALELFTGLNKVDFLSNSQVKCSQLYEVFLQPPLAGLFHFCTKWGRTLSPNTFKVKNTQTCHLSRITLQTEAEWSQTQGQPLLQNKIMSQITKQKKKKNLTPKSRI